MATTSGARHTVRFATVRRVIDETDGYEQDQLFGELVEEPADSELLRRALVPGSSVARRERTWCLGKLVELPDAQSRLAGRIGFVDSATVSHWNAELNDFEDVSVPSGASFGFVLDVERGVLAYLAPASATGGLLSALQAMLNDQRLGRWSVSRVLIRDQWGHWKQGLKRVRNVRVILHRPNPNYRGRKRVEELLEGSRASVLRTLFEADPDSLEGINIEDVYIQQMLEHVENGYGSFAIVGDHQSGPDGPVEEERFDSAADGAEALAHVEGDSGSGEVTMSALSATIDSVDPEAAHIAIEQSSADDDGDNAD